MMNAVRRILRPRKTVTVAVLVLSMLLCVGGASSASAARWAFVSSMATPPTASFTVSTPDTVNQPIMFDASASNDPNSGGAITNYSWDFGDSSSGTGATPSHTYTAAGTYTVTLTVTDAETDTASNSQTFTVSQPPTASFAFAPSTPTAGQTSVSFDGTGSSDPNTGGSLTAYSWDFGDGSAPGTGATPSHTYAAAGTYTVTLTVTDSEGGTATVTHPITGAQPPTAAFTFLPSTPTAGQTSVSFDGTSSSDPNSGGSITAYSWDFGDSSTSTGATPSHTYAAAGTYTVTLTVTDSEGGTATTTQSITVAQPPTAAFTFSPSPPAAGTSVSFDATTSNDPNSGGSITAYSWDFGDGSAPGTGATPSHTYAAAGTYTVTLTVTDSEGGTATVTHPITVAQPPTAAFTFLPSTPTAGQTSVSFDGTSSSDPNSGGSITAYSWDFGDGSAPGTGATPSHTYAAAGTYTVTLTVTDSEGGTATVTHPITVAQPPTAAFTFSPSPPAAGTSVSFDATTSNDPNSGGSITAYSWDFGDSSTGTGATPSHMYPDGGTYTVKLTVTDAEGGTASSTQTVIVADTPATATITATPSSPSVGTVVTFQGTRSGDPDDTTISYAWAFGDHKTATGPTVTHQYQTAGTYTVVLTITDDDGSETTVREVRVAPATVTLLAPTAAFNAPSGQEGVVVGFDGSPSTDPNRGGALGYRWNFGDGGIGAGVHARHAFRAGTWTVTLTVTDSASGKSNSMSHPVTIVDEKPAARFKAPVGRARHKVAFAGNGADPDGSVAAYRWSFGDGGHARGPHVTHTYAKAGRYRVTLTVTDSSGNVATVSHQVVIGGPNACLVPALRGKTLAAGRTRIKAAQCGLLQVNAPKKPSRSPGKGKTWRLIVVTQTPGAGSVDPHGASVRLRLAWHALP